MYARCYAVGIFLIELETEGAFSKIFLIIQICRSYYILFVYFVDKLISKKNIELMQALDSSSMYNIISCTRLCQCIGKECMPMFDKEDT